MESIASNGRDNRLTNGRMNRRDFCMSPMIEK